MNTLPFSQRPTESPRAGHPDDAMMDFQPESPASRSHATPRRGLTWIAVLIAVVAVVAGGAWIVKGRIAPAPTTGALRLESDPSGSAVEINGSLRGLTPLTLNLAPGDYAITVSHEGQTQNISATVTKGIQTVHHLKWSSDAATVDLAQTGRLQIISDPPGGTVTVDGVQRGKSPLSVDALDPGEHQVVLQNLGRTHRRTVLVESGATASLVITNASSASESGWVVPRSSAQLQIFEGGRLVGSTDTDRIMMPVGVHQLEFVSEGLGFRATQGVTVTAGQTTVMPVSLPQATVNFNAVPWADVSIDGTPIGQTPIANLLQTIGTHRVEFRHPELGTKQVTVTVSKKEPARVAVDMRVR
jgi:hypothetical protein